MKTHEDIKKALECCSDPDGLDGDCIKCPYKGEQWCGDKSKIDALAYIQQLEATQPKWISVNDRLPEVYDDGSVDAVLVTDGYFIHMAYFSCWKWRFCESGEMKEEMFYSVTHWMPLPSTEGLDDV